MKKTLGAILSRVIVVLDTPRRVYSVVNLYKYTGEDQRIVSHPKRHKEAIWVILENNIW